MRAGSRSCRSGSAACRRPTRKSRYLLRRSRRVDRAPRQILFERARNRPAKPPVVDFGGHDAVADGERGESPARGFDFGQFRHRSKREDSGARGAQRFVALPNIPYTRSLSGASERSPPTRDGRSTTQEVDLGSFSSLCRRRRDFGSRGRAFWPTGNPRSPPRAPVECLAARLSRNPNRLLGPTARLMRACRPSSCTGCCWGTSRCSGASPRSRRAPTSKRPARRATRRSRERATEIAVGARARSLSIESARLWSEIDPVRAAAEAAHRRAFGQRRREGIRQPGRGQRPQGRARAGARRRGELARRAGRSLHAAQPAARLRARQAGDAAARRIGRAALPRPRRGALRRCARRATTPGSPTFRRRRRRCGKSIVR